LVHHSYLETACATPRRLPVRLQLRQAEAFVFTQIPLPYEKNALEPVIDTMTMDIHYTKHHAAYIKNVNEAIVAEKIELSNRKRIL
jgi:Fe-Mn family superoxide dismutase